MLAYEDYFLIALAVTIAVETGVILLLNYTFNWKIKSADIFFGGFVASFATLPYLWFVIISFIGGSSYLYIGESLVTLFEIFIYKKTLNIGWRKAIIVSLAANISSYLIGRLIF